MRKTNYNFLAKSESEVQSNSPNLCKTALVSNKLNFASLKKLMLFLLIMVFSFTVNAQISVSSSAGTGAGVSPVTYSTLKEAFDSVNSAYFQGTISMSVTGSTTETATAFLQSKDSIAKYKGGVGYTSLLIKPATGVSPSIMGNASVRITIELAASDNVTIDGSNTVGGSTRDLTIGTAYVPTSFQLVTTIYVGSLAGDGATGNTIKNCKLLNTSTRYAYASIYSGDDNTGGIGVGKSNNNTYTNNLLGRANYGIYLRGIGTQDANATINSNNVDSVFQIGLNISNQDGFNIYDNTISSVNTSAAVAVLYGMNFINLCTNGNIYKNNIAKLYQRSSSTTGGVNRAYGLFLGSTSNTSNINIYNNFLSDISTVGVAINYGVYGIRINGGGGYKVYHNTINLTTSPTNPSAITVAVGILTAVVGGVELVNNIIRNGVSGSGTAYALANLTTANVLSRCDNNSYYSATGAINGYTSSGTAAATLAAIQTASGQDANSVIVNATFTSATNLHLSAVAGNALLNNGGTPISGYTTDYDGDTRSTVFPDMGADEIVYTPKIGSFTPTSACSGSTVTLNGADFTGTTAVSLAGVAAASFSVVNPSRIDAVIAGGYTSPTTAVVSVTNASGSASSTGSLTRLAPGTVSSKSLSAGSTGDQVILNGADLLGATAVTFNGVSASFSITNSTEIIATVPSGVPVGVGPVLVTDICGNSVSAGSFNFSTPVPCTTPSNQGTNFVQSALSTSTMSGSFTPASGSPSGYVVVYSTSALSSAPVDGVNHSAGAGFGGTIQQVSASASVSLTGLAGNTAYTVTIYSYNGGGCTGGTHYNTTNPLVYTFTTCTSVPTSVTATPVGTSSGNSINFNWAVPSGGSANSLTYTLDVATDAAFNSPVSGSPFVTTATSQSVTGLNIATRYFYRITANNTACNSSYVSSNVTSVCGAIQTIATTAYSQDFESVTAPAMPGCWTTEDVAGDGNTWKTGAPNSVSGSPSANWLRYDANGTYAGTGSNAAIAANDWAFSPGVYLTGGVSYSVSYIQAAFSNGETYLAKYGTAASSAGMTGANTGLLFTASGLRNQTPTAVAQAFTPTVSGVYYIGFYVTSAAYGTGTTHVGITLQIDNFKLQVTPPPPTAPSALTVPSFGSSSVDLSWTDNSNNEDGFYVYSSLDGTTYTLQTTVGAGVTTATVSNLNASTAYTFKVTAYNTGGESAGATLAQTTASCGGVYTTNTFIGTLFAGTVVNWNTASNWSLGRVPTSCDDVVIAANNLDTSSTSISYLYLNANASMHNFTMTAQNSKPTNAAGARQVLFVYTNGFAMKIGGNLVISNDSTAGGTSVNDNLLLIAGGGSGGASIVVEGTTTVGATGNRISSVGGASGFADFVFRDDVTLGAQAFLNFGALNYYVFDANGSQTLTINSTQNGGTSYGLGNLTVGRNNNTTLTIAGSGTSPASQVVGDLAINGGSSLIIPAGQTMNRNVAGGNFTMGTNSTLKVGGVTGGVGNSNFPSLFSTFVLGTGSTVEYNGTAAQQIASAPSYWHLKVNNAAGVSLTANTLVTYDLNFAAGILSTGAFKLTSGLYGSVTGSGASSYVNGTLAKTISAATSSTLFEIGDASVYTPTTVGFAGGATNSGGVFSAKTTAGMPSSLGFTLSGISTVNYLNRTYTLNNAGVTGFTSLSPVFNYASGDLVGNPSNAAYRVSVSNGGYSLAATTNPTSTSTSATAVSLASGGTADFVLGEIDPAPAPTVNEPSASTVCEGFNFVITGTNFYAITGVTIGGANVPTFTVNSPTQITILVPNGIASGVIAVSNATGTATTTGSLATSDQPQTTVGTSNQTICSGASVSIAVGNTSNLAGTTYSWTRTGNISGGTAGTSGTSNISGTLISTSTVNELATFTVTSTGPSPSFCVGTTAISTVTVKASPGVVNVSPAGTSSICENNSQQLVANYTAATGTSVTNSGAITVAIPDGNLAGVNTQLVVSDIPAGAIITGIAVQFDITHGYNSDLVINLKAPNGKVLNLVNQLGATPNTSDFFGTDFYHTVISSASGLPNLPTFENVDSATGTWAPDAVGGVGPSGFTSTNGISFADLYSVANGNWKLALRDIGTPDVGTLKNWKITINYTLAPTFSWLKVGGGYAGLYTDAGFTPYTGGSQQTVYAKNTAGSYSYTADITFNGCSASSSVATIDVQAIANATVTPSSNETICSGTAMTSRSLSSASDAGATLNWSRDQTSNVSGTVGNSGSGLSGAATIAGTLINTTSSPITVTFTVTPNGSGSLSCSGTPVTFTVTVNPSPLASVTPSSQNACSGSAINPLIFTTTNGVSGTTYAWTRDNTTAATGIAASGTNFVSGTLTNASGITTVTFSVSAVGPGVSACAGTPTTATVTVYNAASIFNVTGGGSFCFPGAGLPVGLSNSQSGYTYQLLLDGSPLGSPVAGTGGALNFGNQTSGGTYTATANNAGCARPMNGSAMLTAINTVTPTISIITSRTTICAGSNATFFAVATNTGSNPTYTFKVNGNTAQSGANKVFITSTLANGDVVSSELTSTNTCQTSFLTASNNLPMTVTAGAFLPAPAAITGRTTQCTIGGLTYLASSTSGGVWSSSDTMIAKVLVNGTVIARANGVAIISYTVSASNGCQNSAAVDYTVAQQAAPNAVTGQATLCVGSTATYSTTSTGGVWSTLGRASINSTTGFATGTSGGATAIRYTITNAAGCGMFTDRTITVNARPGVPSMAYAAGRTNPQAGAPAQGFCKDRTFSLVGSPLGGVWTSGNSSTATITSLGSVTTLTNGPMSITYTFTNANGCSNSRTASAIIYTCASRGVNLNDAPKPDEDFTLYPNPAKGRVSFNTEFAEAGGRITVTDMFGKTVRTLPLSIGTNNIDISALSKGFYIVSMITKNGMKTKKLIVE